MHFHDFNYDLINTCTILSALSTCQIVVPDILYIGAIGSRTFVSNQSACSGFEALYFGKLVVLTMSCRRRAWHESSSHNLGSSLFS